VKFIKSSHTLRKSGTLPPILKLALNEFKRYFSGRVKKFTVPIAFIGTEFEITVWKILMKIPYGKTLSYKDVALSLRKPFSYRAVANACGKNGVAIIVPCHRVILSTGEIGGYSSELLFKKKLLALEQGVLG
jgi:methylated-DNA-[protein]-cysteine S-methyltransferase